MISRLHALLAVTAGRHPGRRAEQPMLTSGERRQERGLNAFFLIASVVFALAMFRGLEWHSGYHGSAYQAIHPGSFPNDPFMAPARPTMQSLLYLVVRMVGDWWLDDRVTFLVFIGVAFVTLLGVDRTAQVLGGRHWAERVALVSLMLLEHRILDNHALAIDNYEFNPTTMSAPVIVWLWYQALHGGRPGVVLSLMALAASISVKNAWLPCLGAALLLWRGALRPRGRAITTVLALAAIVGALGFYYGVIRLRQPSDVALFNYLVTTMDKREANPFFDSWAANLLFVALGVAGLRLRTLPAAVGARVRALAGLGLAVWFFGGLYFSYAPDAMKIPYLVPFDVTRALWWVQYVLYVALGVAILKWVQRAGSVGGLLVAWMGWVGLVAVHQPPRWKLVALMSAMTAIGAWWLRRGGHQRRVIVVGLAAGLSVVTMYGVGTLHHRRAPLEFLFRYGVVGDNGTAKWVGVAEYLRQHTPAGAVVLALTDHDALGRTFPLGYDGALRTRAGRSMPLGHPAAFYFNYPKLLWAQERAAHTEAVAQAWVSGDLPRIAQALRAVGTPAYIVAPSRYRGSESWLRQLGYQEEATIGSFVIVKRIPDGSD